MSQGRTHISQRRNAWLGRHGFTLVVTPSLMNLLTIIAVGLRALSSISLRGSTVAGAQPAARAKPRMGDVLRIALQ